MSAGAKRRLARHGRGALRRRRPGAPTAGVRRRGRAAHRAGLRGVCGANPPATVAAAVIVVAAAPAESGPGRMGRVATGAEGAKKENGCGWFEQEEEAEGKAGTTDDLGRAAAKGLSSEAATILAARLLAEEEQEQEQEEGGEEETEEEVAAT
jgi:hypothetical protein